MKNIRVSLNPRSVENAIQELKAYRDSMESKCRTICERLTSLGAVRASMEFSLAAYTGPKDFNISVEEVEGEPGKIAYRVIADGESVLFIEFGSGIAFDNAKYAHPMAKEITPKMGPGTYPCPPGKGHWDDPGGWWLPPEKGGGHTFGNPAGMPMYLASRTMRDEIERVAKEVFSAND